MRSVLKILMAFAIAAAIGLGLTRFAVEQTLAFGGISAGAWTAYPRKGTSAADPYARATLARSGELPIVSGDGIAFTAKADDEGRKLDGRCDIVVAGLTPVARFFTLTAYRPDGTLIPNPAGRHGFTSQEVVRSIDGRFEVRLAPRARPGNWLPSGGEADLVLVLRLYDTPVGIATRAGVDTTMPSVRQEACP